MGKKTVKPKPNLQEQLDWATSALISMSQYLDSTGMSDMNLSRNIFKEMEKRGMLPPTDKKP
jgi:hypothetical protein